MFLVVDGWGTLRQEFDPLQAANVPEASPGRGLTKDGYHFLAALPRLDSRATVTDLPDALRAVVTASAEAWTRPRAPEVRLLPSAFPHTELVERATAPDAGPVTGIPWA